MPFILTGVRQAVALGLIGVVVGEMFGGSEGIGYMVNYGGQTFQTDTVFLGVMIIALSGIVLTWLAERLETALFAVETGAVSGMQMQTGNANGVGRQLCWHVAYGRFELRGAD